MIGSHLPVQEAHMQHPPTADDARSGDGAPTSADHTYDGWFAQKQRWTEPKLEELTEAQFFARLFGEPRKSS